MSHKLFPRPEAVFNNLSVQNNLTVPNDFKGNQVKATCIEAEKINATTIIVKDLTVTDNLFVTQGLHITDEAKKKIVLENKITSHNEAILSVLKIHFYYTENKKYRSTTDEFRDNNINTINQYLLDYNLKLYDYIDQSNQLILKYIDSLPKENLIDLIDECNHLAIRLYNEQNYEFMELIFKKLKNRLSNKKSIYIFKKLLKNNERFPKEYVDKLILCYLENLMINLKKKYR